MQSTLEDIEMSAVHGAQVFGPEHSQALESLRAAQIGLAQAWGRSEEGLDGGDDQTPGLGKLGSEGKSMLDGTGTIGDDSTSRSRAASDSGRPASSVQAGAEQAGHKLEEETEADIAYARKRREDNDRYFQKVNKGVLDVVARLDDVAKAMMSVEMETREIWDDNASAVTSPKE